MLTGVQVAMLGGDARQLEIIRKLTELDAKIYLAGFDQLDRTISGSTKVGLEDIPFEQLDAIILPVAGLQANGEVETIFSNTSITITTEILKRTPEHCIILTGISPPLLTNMVKEADRKLICLFDRDDVAIYNSIPTAEGAVMIAMQHTDFTIHDSTILVIGMGRVGMTVARTFKQLGAKVKLGARKSEHLARAFEMGIEPFPLTCLASEAETADIIINTVPFPIITSTVIAKMQPHTLIVDLASKPGGTDFNYAKKRGVNAILALGLPGVVAPKTAGQILADVIVHVLTTEE